MKHEAPKSIAHRMARIYYKEEENPEKEVREWCPFSRFNE
jgi:hypothetical protein